MRDSGQWTLICNNIYPTEDLDNAIRVFEDAALRKAAARGVWSLDLKRQISVYGPYTEIWWYLG